MKDSNFLGGESSPSASDSTRFKGIFGKFDLLIDWMQVDLQNSVDLRSSLPSNTLRGFGKRLMVISFSSVVSLLPLGSSLPSPALRRTVLI